MAITHTLSNIVATETEALRYIWSDGYFEEHAPDWTGFTRGVVAGHSDAGEYERYDGTDPFNPEDLVVDLFLAIDGNSIEAYATLSETASNILNAPDSLVGGPTLGEIFNGR